MFAATVGGPKSRRCSKTTLGGTRCRTSRPVLSPMSDDPLGVADFCPRIGCSVEELLERSLDRNVKPPEPVAPPKRRGEVKRSSNWDWATDLITLPLKEARSSR